MCCTGKRWRRTRTRKQAFDEIFIIPNQLKTTAKRDFFFKGFFAMCSYEEEHQEHKTYPWDVKKKIITGADREADGDLGTVVGHKPPSTSSPLKGRFCKALSITRHVGQGWCHPGAVLSPHPSFSHRITAHKYSEMTTFAILGNPGRHQDFSLNWTPLHRPTTRWAAFNFPSPAPW